jgi:hypothetical protein
MSFRWPNKDPDETLDYSVDWSRFMGTGVTVVSVQWYVKTTAYTTKTLLLSGQTLATASSGASTDTIQNVSQTHTSTVATINIGGGTNNEEYTFYCRMTDSSGSTAERAIKLRLKER